MGTHGIRNRVHNLLANWKWTRMRATIAVIVVLVGALEPLMAYAVNVWAASPRQSAVYHPHPNQSRFTITQAPRRFPPNPKALYSKPGVFQPMRHPFTPMQPLVMPLTQVNASGEHAYVSSISANGISSDGMLEVMIPANAISAADIALPDSPAQLVITEIAPPSGSSDGGIITTGTYLFQVQDAYGHEVANGMGLRQSIQISLHMPGMDPNKHVYFALNELMPAALPVAARHFGPHARYAMRYDTKSKSVTTVVPLAASSTGGSATTNSPESYFGKPDLFQDDAHTADLSLNIPIDAPAGPGGLTPQLSLDYNSGAVDGSHNIQAAAPWVGEGWTLDPGEITWSESYDPAANTNTSPASNQWRSSWSISDPYGTSGDLIAAMWNAKTYYDDTPFAITTSQMIWHTAPESRAKIISYTNPTVDCAHFPNASCSGGGSYSTQPPCFRVWLPSGIMEEFGCTFDSRQWYPAGSNGTTNYVSAWKLDLITDPSGNQIHFTYDQDWNTVNGVTYPRDLVLHAITWDSPGCHDPNNACSPWNPLMQITFAHSNTVAHPLNSNAAYACAAQASGIRCDDPIPAGANGANPNIGTPQLTQTQVLNDLTVQVRSSASDSWHKLRNYLFEYKQGQLGNTYVDDPFASNTTISDAGYLLLEQIKVTGTDSTAYPAQNFRYTAYTQYYEDSYYHAWDANCGPSWNTSTCALWTESYNGYYITEADNGMGLQQTFAYDDLRTNQHGVYSGDATDTLNCTKDEATNGANTKYPCNLPDDEGWSRIGLTQRTITENSPTAQNSSQQNAGTWYYDYHLANLTSHECNDCNVGMYWGNANSADQADYYNGRFMGFAFAQAERPDGVTTDDTYEAGEGWGVWSSTVQCQNSPGLWCQQSPYWDLPNAANGKLLQEDVVSPQSGYPVMQRTTYSYTDICPAPGVTSLTANGLYTYNRLVATQDADNPVASCDVRLTSKSVYLANGVTSPPSYGAINGVPSETETYSYDQNETNAQYSHLTSVTTTGNDLGNTPTIVHYTSNVWNDSVQTGSAPPTGTYIVDQVYFSDIEDGSHNQQQCAYYQYDGMSSAVNGQQSGLTRGLATQVNRYTACPQSGTKIVTKTGYDSYGNAITSTDADANGGVSGHTAPTGSLCAGVTTCTTYDATFNALPTQVGDALGHTSATTAYSTAQQFGFGLWPQSVTDANGQATSFTYDGLGRTLSTTLPQETYQENTTNMVYSNSCPATGPNQPCLEVDTIQRLDGSHQVTSRAFYDGMGNLVETRKPGPVSNNQDVVQFSLYDNIGRIEMASVPYFVASGTGYSIPDTTQPHTSYTYDALDRATQVTDPNSAVTTTSYSTPANVAGTDGAVYFATATVDADQHQHIAYTDALGRKVYAQDFTGAGPYTLYRTYQYVYDYLGDLTKTVYGDGGHSAQVTYDALGEQKTVTDPDLGTLTYTYDPNGNEISSQDGRGASGTAYYGYDGLNRMKWISASSAGTNPFASYTYDSGTNGIGHLTQENFASGPNQSVTGSYAYGYDARGQLNQKTITISGVSQQFQFTFNDAGQPTSVAFPDNTDLTTTYDTNDWFSGAATQTATVVTNVYYANLAGAAGKITNEGLGNNTMLVNWYDDDLQQTKAILSQNSVTTFEEDRAFDAAGNVVTKATTLPQGMVYQTFCYDEQNRIVWAGSTNTPSCGTALQSGTFTSAQYYQTFSYDTLDRLGGLRGTTTFGDGTFNGSANTSTPLDAVTSGSWGYSATYDAAGEMTCRAPANTATCTGTVTGQQLSYDALNRLIAWQNQPSSPTSTDLFAYDGEGQRVWQQSTSSGTTTTTAYFGGYEEQTTKSGVTTTTKYYAAGQVTLEDQRRTLSYLLSDGLGSVSIAMNTSGTITSDAIFKPFGANLYHNSSMPTAKGFTGQDGDAVTGLDYYNARYYDPIVGQFVTPDTVQGPNRFLYVGGNPETLIDPSGQDWSDVWQYLMITWSSILPFFNMLQNVSGNLDFNQQFAMRYFRGEPPSALVREYEQSYAQSGASENGEEGLSAETANEIFAERSAGMEESTELTIQLDRVQGANQEQLPWRGNGGSKPGNGGVRGARSENGSSSTQGDSSSDGTTESEFQRLLSRSNRDELGRQTDEIEQDSAQEEYAAVPTSGIAEWWNNFSSGVKEGWNNISNNIQQTWNNIFKNSDETPGPCACGGGPDSNPEGGPDDEPLPDPGLLGFDI